MHSVRGILHTIKGGYSIKGNQSKSFSNIRPILEANPDSLVFIDSHKPDKQALAKQTMAGIVICDDSIIIRDDWLRDKCFIIVENPKQVFAAIGNLLFKKKLEYKIHPTAIIHPAAKLHTKVYIGPFVYVGQSQIDEGAVIHSHCNICDNVHIGENVIIKPGCIIGSDGFGYLMNEEEEYENFPHIGGVIIEDNVEIGANVTIDRGALGNTHVKKGAKIDNLVHIAHNAVIGRHSIIIAGAVICGSAVIGDYSWIAPSVVINNNITIGKKTKIGIGSAVIRSVPDGETWFGVPAESLRNFVKSHRRKS